MMRVYEQQVRTIRTLRVAGLPLWRGHAYD
jgi:hypothetical protein